MYKLETFELTKELRSLVMTAFQLLTDFVVCKVHNRPTVCVSHTVLLRQQSAVKQKRIEQLCTAWQVYICVIKESLGQFDKFGFHMLPSFSYFSGVLGVSTNELLLFYPLVDTNSLLAKICHRFPWFTFSFFFMEHQSIKYERFSFLDSHP